MFMTYDLRSAQRFIFRVPVLQAIIGGSGLIVEFDDYVSQRGKDLGVAEVFSNAGHGLFSIRDDQQHELRELMSALRSKATEFAMDLRIGTGETPHQALTSQQEFPFIPPTEEMEGEPCYISGLYPFDPHLAGSVDSRREVNHRVFRRFRLDDPTNPEHPRKASERIDNRVLGLLRGTWEAASGRDTRFAKPTELEGVQIEFLRTVSALTDSDDPDAHDLEQTIAKAGMESLGARNRWAIICMDGNNIGAQFQEISRDRAGYSRELHTGMSAALQACTNQALSTGIAASLREWCQEFPEQVTDASYTKRDGKSRSVVVPIRPLIFGGDDLVLLCHPSLAFTFVREAIRGFHSTSRALNDAYASESGGQLWAPTGGSLTISAGVLFSSVTFPLHLSIPYAEELLASAKSKGSGLAVEGEPTPPCIDWDSTTEGLLESLHARRRREYEVLDRDSYPPGKEQRPDEEESSTPGRRVRFTARPYTLTDFEGLIGHCSRVSNTWKVPKSILARARSSMRAGYWDREAARLSLAKHHPEFAEALDETPAVGRRTPHWLETLDAIDILAEVDRMKWRTAE